MNDIDKCLKRLHDRFAWRFWAVAVSHSAKPHRQDEPISIAICVWITQLCSCRAVGRSINPCGVGASGNPRAFASILDKIWMGGGQSLPPGSEGSVVAGCCGTCNFNLFQARWNQRARWAIPPQDFGSYIFPIQTRRANYAHHITVRPTRFSDFPTALLSNTALLLRRRLKLSLLLWHESWARATVAWLLA